MKNKLFVLSLVINVVGLLLIGYVIHKKGGVNYIMQKMTGSSGKFDPDGYRSYYDTKYSIFELMPNDTNEIIFLGNSITDRCNWHELFGLPNIKNRGIGGDVIEGVVNRIDEVTESKPRKIFLMIGTNDLASGNSVEKVLADYEKLVQLILEKTPNTELYLQSLLPTKDDPNRRNSDIIKINAGIAQLAEAHSLTYINIFDLLKTEDNELDTSFSYDNLHINGKAYLIWKDEIEEYVNR